MMEAVLAFDVGGTRIKAGVVQGSSVSSLLIEPLDEKEGADGVLSIIVRMGRHLIAQHAVTAVGISIKGIVDPHRGTILDVKEALTSCIGEPIAERLAHEFRLPTVLENDARMYTLGELLYGAGRTANNLVCLTLGTGVGSGVALGRRVLRGPRGISGILGGHITLQTNGPRCTCGNIGCLEALIGTAALVREATIALATGRPSSLRVVCGHCSRARGARGEQNGPLTPQRIFAASAAGDRVARELVQRFAELLGAGIVSLVHTHDPDIVVLGGGMIGAAEQFLPIVQAYVTAHVWTLPLSAGIACGQGEQEGSRGRRVEVVAAELGDAAALVGVAAFARGFDAFL